MELSLIGGRAFNKTTARNSHPVHEARACLQQMNQFLQAPGREVTELSGMTFPQRLGNFLQKCGADRSDTDQHRPAIFPFSDTLDQPALFQLVEHSRDVGGARNQPIGNHQRWE